jgi:hypothetical protein
MSIPKVCVLPLFLAAFTAFPAPGQQCPQSNAKESDIPSQIRTLKGQLVYHDGIRKWFELKLDQSQCGQTSVQLVQEGDDWKRLEILRGCRVNSKGPIDFSPTGYYSLDTYQSVQHIESIGTCAPRPPFPDDSKAKPDKTVRDYRVDMQVNYKPGDHPVLFRVTSAGKELQPWQAYASYMLTGGFVLYGLCGEGFVVDKVFGTPQADPSHFAESRDSEDMAMFDPEGAAASGKTDLHLGYTCVRKP